MPIRYHLHYVYKPDGIFSPVVVESFVLYDTGYPLPSNGILLISGDVGTPVITPDGLDLSVQSYNLGVVYTDEDGEKPTASLPVLYQVLLLLLQMLDQKNIHRRIRSRPIA